MNKREMMLRQINATLKIEKEYVRKFNDLLKSPNITEENRIIIEELKQASLEAIARHKRFRLLYM
ncbi:hypothetical protein [Paramaledivibacter caminithermalis]|jgi:hypothetical protein|uniref:Uncharacterized protein n=1 Tax=Paramaledivibacter caminithermalis (strain DSM 15212 / CIP 107654 / DViRD3) TaxID=1121301 RepID=A0A1M6TWJ9_PARC5|nr:hypothetical protein [Paramaledivibacter caminithermalis]SHK61188.1 hypothetical protein SAMN02745912_03811 [Paramaledivibacter caminithermalis DSM 15212]